MNGRCHFRIQMLVTNVFILLCIDAALSQIATSGSFYRAVGSNEVLDDNAAVHLGLDHAFYECDRRDSCSTVAKPKDGNKVRTDDDKLNKSELQKQAFVYQKQSHENTDCKYFHDKGFKTNGVYPYKRDQMQFPVYCDMTTSSKPWIVFQRRVDDSVDFNRTWNEYKSGFGDIRGNFWLGLERLHQFAPAGSGAILRVDFRHVIDTDKLFYAEYNDFKVAAEADDYSLFIGGFHGNVGDSLSNHNAMRFSTKDRDNDRARDMNCANLRGGGWWYKMCQQANLNVLFPPHPYNIFKPQYMSWFAVDNKLGGVFYSEMKLTYSMHASSIHFT